MGRVRITPLHPIIAIALCASCVGLAGAQETNSAPQHSFSEVGDHLELDGKPFQIISGELHYERIPRAYWRARLRMAKAMGLNTIATYVFWNIHEPRPNEFDFKGNADLPEFVREAGQEGLKVLLRAGPYSCAEWEFGGFPAWLMKNPHMRTALRSNDPAFMEPVERWIDRLGHEIAAEQIGRGGPIIAVQIENEYGNFGSDHAYMEHLHQIFLRAGFDRALLYTADPSRALANGSIPGVFAAVNFGGGHAQAGLDALAKLRPGQALFASEYWPGWFDHWGQPHQTRPIEPQIQDLDYILSHHAGINIYMFHGGTSFGMMSGSSWTNSQFLPDVTSYDYDAPLDEAGHPTAKYSAYRAELAKFASGPLPPIPAAPPVMRIPEFELSEATPLWAGLPQPIHAEKPEPMEQYGQSYGFILYRHRMKEPIRGTLKLAEMNDYALVYLNGRLAGALDRSAKQSELQISADTPDNQLDILVENSGRINSTKMMRGENKGLSGDVELNGQTLTGWDIYPLPMTPASIADTLGTPTEARFGKHENASPALHGPAFYRGNFVLKSKGNPMPDTFLDVRDLGKGAVWINGHPVGRYWNIGPQKTFFVPGPWLHAGRNEILVLDLFARTHLPRVAGLDHAILNAPTQQFTAAPDENIAPPKVAQ